MGVRAVAHRAVHSPVLRMALIEMACGALAGFGHVVPFIQLGRIGFGDIVHWPVANNAGDSGVGCVEG